MILLGLGKKTTWRWFYIILTLRQNGSKINLLRVNGLFRFYLAIEIKKDSVRGL